MRPGLGRGVLELLRLPNVFTAWGDVLLGYWLVQALGRFGDPGPLLLLVAATTGLYLGGMVLNDAFDAAEDAQERPERPIPSGRIRRGEALALGLGLLAAGVAAGFVVGTVPGLAAAAVAGLVLLYDGVLKRTPAAFVGMGLCRAGNVLLGLSPALPALWRQEPADPALLDSPFAADPLGAARALGEQWWLVPAANGVYVAGVTLFARTEAVRSRRPLLVGGVGLILAGLGLHAWTLSHTPLQNDRALWLIAAVAVLLGLRFGPALLDPSPARVQRAVMTSILTLLTIDATLLLGYQTGQHAVAVLALWLPSLYLGRWLYGT